MAPKHASSTGPHGYTQGVETLRVEYEEGGGRFPGKRVGRLDEFVDDP